LESKAEHVNHSLVEEIAILRDLVVRINQMAEDELTLPELRRVLDSLSKASVRLVNLLQAWPAYNAAHDQPDAGGAWPTVMLHYAINRSVGRSGGNLTWRHCCAGCRAMPTGSKTVCGLTVTAMRSCSTLRGAGRRQRSALHARMN